MSFVSVVDESALHKKGININAQSTTGDFRHIPLNLATKDELKSVFDLLIKLGADVNVKMANGNTVWLEELIKNQLRIREPVPVFVTPHN